MEWVAYCGPGGPDGHPTNCWTGGSFVVPGTTPTDDIAGFGGWGICGGIRYYIRATNAAGVFWTEQLGFNGACN